MVKSVDDRVIDVIVESLKIDRSEVHIDSNVYQLCLQSLQGTREKLNRPHPKDGLRPTDIRWVTIVFALEDEFEIEITEDDATNVDTVGDLIGVVNSSESSSQD